MTIDFWGLGLQAVNVLILVWLLSRVFWRPVAGAIASRQQTTRATLDAAAAAQAKADAMLAEVTQARAGIAAERTALLDAARTEAVAATEAAMAEARSGAEATVAAARMTIARDSETARTANAAQATTLSLDMAATLLRRLNTPTVQAAFLAQLVEAVAALPVADRATLARGDSALEIVSAADPGPDRPAIETAVRAALGGTAPLRFVTDPDLIAGLELRSPHFVVHNSWRADLNQIRKAVQDAA